jgi:outer membrane protein OmpA-like peptidoglycan-associated protein
MKKFTTLLIISLGVVLGLAGCGPRKSLVVLIPDADGHVGQLVVANEGGQQVLNKANQSVLVTDRQSPPSEITILSDDEIHSIFSDVLEAQPLPPAQFMLYFLEDSNELTDESKAILPEIIQTIRKRGSTDIVITGHTDTFGAKEYNYKLARYRAKVLSDILVAHGVVSANITVTSHGEGNPLIKTDDGVIEPRNRRVEVVIK